MCEARARRCYYCCCFCFYSCGSSGAIRQLLWLGARACGRDGGRRKLRRRVIRGCGWHVRGGGSKSYMLYVYQWQFYFSPCHCLSFDCPVDLHTRTHARFGGLKKNNQPSTRGAGCRWWSGATHGPPPPQQQEERGISSLLFGVSEARRTGWRR